MLRDIFREIKESRKITATAISQATGIDPKHISLYLKGKRDVTSETLWRMLEAMEKLAPGAKLEFGRKILGDSAEISFKGLDEQELADAMIKLGKAWEELRSRESHQLVEA